MIWKHINFYFNEKCDPKNYEKGLGFDLKKLERSSNYPRQPYGEYYELVDYIRWIVQRLGGKIERFFFLFEDEPHLFLALEFKEDPSQLEILTMLSEVERPYFVKVDFQMTNGHDEENGEHALDMFYASSRFALWRCSKEYASHYLGNNENKIIHCFCNMNFVSWKRESVFYMVGLLQRGVSFQYLFWLIREMLEWRGRKLRASFKPWGIFANKKSKDSRV